MRQSKEYLKLLGYVAAQGKAFERRARSRIEIQYGESMRSATKATIKFTATASLDELIQAEKSFQTTAVRILVE